MITKIFRKYEAEGCDCVTAAKKTAQELEQSGYFKEPGNLDNFHAVGREVFGSAWQNKLTAYALG